MSSSFEEVRALMLQSLPACAPSVPCQSVTTKPLRDKVSDSNSQQRSLPTHSSGPSAWMWLSGRAHSQHLRTLVESPHACPLSPPSPTLQTLTLTPTLFSCIKSYPTILWYLCLLVFCAQSCLLSPVLWGPCPVFIHSEV